MLLSKQTLAMVASILVLQATGVVPVLACTRILSNADRQDVIVGRTMDWHETTDPALTVFPRGMERDGGKVGPVEVVKENPLRWTSKYGSLVTTIYGVGTADGFNERGLGVHLLFLAATDFGPRDVSLPGVQAALWPQYLLDNAASVTEALALLEKIQIVMAEAHGNKATVHLALDDAGGDSAIIEYVGGKPLIHHGREYKIMTNDPAYDQQLALLKAQDFSKPSDDLSVPGNVNPRDRFQRAAYYLSILPAPKTEREAIAGVLAITRNASVPFGAPYSEFGVYNTEYRTVMDLTNKTYYFELTTTPNVIWADLGKFDLRPGAPVKTLNPDNLNLSGDVSGKFQRAKAPF